jgi:hypothetical protein
MLWRLLQLAVFFAVFLTGVYYEWTPNGLVLTSVAALCAFGATVFLGDFFRLVRWSRKKGRAILSQQGAQQGEARGRDVVSVDGAVRKIGLNRAGHEHAPTDRRDGA